MQHSWLYHGVYYCIGGGSRSLQREPSTIERKIGNSGHLKLEFNATATYEVRAYNFRVNMLLIDTVHELSCVHVQRKQYTMNYNCSFTDSTFLFFLEMFGVQSICARKLIRLKLR